MQGEDGELLATDYPTEFVQGESQPIVIGIGNQEHEQMSYTVVIELQRVAVIGNDTRVEEKVEFNRFTLQLVHNETRHVTYEIRPWMIGTRLRLAFLLYVEAPPPRPTVENTYRELHLWINVSRPTDATASTTGGLGSVS